MNAQMLLCDWAEEVGGKLYIQGAGWSRLATNDPVSIAVAILLEVPWDRANSPHDIKVALLTEDGEPFVPPDETDPVAIEGKVELGRTPGMRPGTTLDVPLAIKFQGISFPLGGYCVEFAVDGEVLVTKSFGVD